MTTKRAFTMLHQYSGKVEECENGAFPDGAILVTRALLCGFLEWIEYELYSEEQHFLAVQEKNIRHEEKVTDVTADHSNPPTPQEKKEANETCAKYPQLGWYSQKFYQMLALNCKGGTLAMIKALAAGEYEATRGVTAWYRLTRDHGGCATNPGTAWTSFSTPTRKCQTFLATLSCGKVAFGSTRSCSTRRRKF